MIEIISGVWAAGETKTFQIGGQYLEILDAQYPCDVVLMDRTGSQQSFMRGAEASFFTRPSGGFETVQITSVQAQTLRFFVGSGDAGTRRISSTVSVVDGAKARVMARVAYVASCAIGVTAGQMNQIALVNPAGSGVALVVNGIAFSATGASTAYLVSGSGLPAGSVNLPNPSKLIGSPASSRSYRREATSAALGSMEIVGVGVAAGESTQVPLADPFVVLPGNYFGARAEPSNALVASIQYFEEAI